MNLLFWVQSENKRSEENMCNPENGGKSDRGKIVPREDDVPKFDLDDDSFYGEVCRVPFYLGLLNSIASLVLLMFCYARNYIPKLLFAPRYANDLSLYDSFEGIYKKFFFGRLADCFSPPVTSIASTQITIKEQRVRCSKNRFLVELTGRKRTVINLGSYNYLGMNQNKGPIADSVERCIRANGVSTCASRAELGEFTAHQQFEKLFASFLGVEDCITFGMGFATNSLNIPSLLGRNCLVISDERNHASILSGCKDCSHSVKRIFKHNDMNDLELKLKEAIVRGNSAINRPWRKIIVIVEGIYSMEGTMCKLRQLIRLRDKYKFYLYVDEAHSIGAVGQSGRGVCQLLNVNPNDVDILMGTFTKSFAGSGGYIAGSKKLIDHLRINSPGFIYATSMSPVIVEQITASLAIITHPIDGAIKANNLAANVAYFRRKLHEKNLFVMGSPASPVVPVLVVGGGPASYSYRTLAAKGVGIVVAGFPATEFNQERMRLCLSSDHTKEMLDHTLQIIFDLADRGVLPVKGR